MIDVNDVKFKDSYYNLWASIISLTHVDNFVSDEEKATVTEMIKDLRLDEDRKKSLHSLLESAEKPDFYIDKITIPAHISQLHHFANMIFRIDNFDYKEQKYLDSLQELILKQTNILGALKMIEEDKRVENLRPKEEREGFFGYLIDFFDNTK
ncbi:MAG: hypothetical protein VX341_00695 [Bdellovibrionota bacterium]|nr:hypothetical protein [Bdellovibrionota bacterium]